MPVKDRTALQQCYGSMQVVGEQTVLIAGCEERGGQDGHPCHRAPKGLTCLAFWRIGTATIAAIPGTRTSANACGRFSHRRSLAPDFREQRLVRSDSEEPGASDNADVLLETRVRPPHSRYVRRTRHAFARDF